MLNMEETKLTERLFQLAKVGNLSHAYIFEGKNGNNVSIALTFAKVVTDYQEDIIHIKADGKSIKDAAIEELQERLTMKPMVGVRNIAIIEDADTMTVRAQNRLLKTLEEPAGNAIIILLSENIENLLPTILSRCVLYRVGTESNDDRTEEVRRHAEAVGTMLLEGKGFYTFIPIVTEVTANRQQALAFLDALQIWYRDQVVLLLGTEIKCSAYMAVKLIEEARQDINRNVNIGYAIKNLILNMMKSGGKERHHG